MSTENKGGGGRRTLSTFCPLCSPSLLFSLCSAGNVTYAAFIVVFVSICIVYSEPGYIGVSRSCDMITSEWEVSLSEETQPKHMMLKVWLDYIS